MNKLEKFINQLKKGAQVTKAQRLSVSRKNLNKSIPNGNKIGITMPKIPKNKLGL